MWFWFFIISASANLLLAFYIRWLLKTLSAINIDIEGVSEIIQSFSNHVKSIHELEMFYGDQTLQGLMSHANELTKSLESIDLVLNNQDDTLDQPEVTDEAS